MNILYRYSNGTGECIVLEVYPVVKATPAGKWINTYGTKRFVLNDSHKRFACDTKEAALESFIARKRRQLRLLKVQMESAQTALAHAEKSTPDTVVAQYDTFTFDA